MAELPQIRVAGPDVTAESAREVGEAFADLFNAVAESKGFPAGMVRVGAVRVACDAFGCDATREWESTDGWWRSADGRDFCPTHTATREGGSDE